MTSNPQPSNNHTFLRLRRSYLIALGIIVLSILIEQALVVSFLEDQRNDAEIINIAGRQRMLSQRIVKQMVFNYSNTDELYTLWQQRHNYLKTQLATTDTYWQLKSLDTIVDRYLEGKLNYTDSLSEVFLLKMDAIVNDLSFRAEKKVIRLQLTKWILFAFTGVVLLLELLFIFKPITRFIARQFTAVEQERQAQEMARIAAEDAVEKRDQSIRALQSLNSAIDEAVLFASLRRDGSPIYLSAQLTKLLGQWESGVNQSLVNKLHPSSERRSLYRDILQQARADSWKGEWEIIDAQGLKKILSVTLVPTRVTHTETELFLLANDITTYKESQRALEELSLQRLKEQEAQSKLRSRQIIEAEEQERLRIARDLHDGIGQKLTGLKMGLESIPITNSSDQKERITALIKLAKEIIMSIRVTTFNLSPPELEDYGLIVALEKLCKELSKLSGQLIVFEHTTEMPTFGTEVELSIYRIIQEAINNAIKYAGADYILVSISPGNRIFSISVTDNGTGFVSDQQEEKAGLGLKNMASRVEDLNGRIFVRSDPETGTKITVNLPLDDA